MTNVLEELEENEKNTIVNCLTAMSQGMTLNEADQFNHLAGIVDKVKASMEPKLAEVPSQQQQS